MWVVARMHVWKVLFRWKRSPIYAFLSKCRDERLLLLAALWRFFPERVRPILLILWWRWKRFRTLYGGHVHRIACFSLTFVRHCFLSVELKHTWRYKLERHSNSRSRVGKSNGDISNISNTILGFHFTKPGIERSVRFPLLPQPSNPSREKYPAINVNTASAEVAAESKRYWYI